MLSFIHLAMNAQMRRIDLVCKLIGPLFIASIESVSTDRAIIVNLLMNITSVVVEYFSIAKVIARLSDLKHYCYMLTMPFVFP